MKEGGRESVKGGRSEGTREKEERGRKGKKEKGEKGGGRERGTIVRMIRYGLYIYRQCSV